MGIIYGMVGLDANDVLIKALLNATQGSIVIIAIYAHVMMYKGDIYQGKFRHKMMRLVGRY